MDGLMGAPANIPPPPPPIISEALPKSAIPIEALLTGAAMAVAFAALISWVVALTLSKTRLADLLVQLRQSGIALVVIEHHMDLIMSVADRIVVLNQGAMLATGTPDEVRGNPKVQEAYLGGTH